MMQDTTESLNSAGSYNTIEPLPLTPSVPSWKTSAPATIAAPQMRVSRLSGGTVVEGFANQIPLVIALRQVVPESYQLTYGTNVPLGSDGRLERRQALERRVDEHVDAAGPYRQRKRHADQD